MTAVAPAPSAEAPEQVAPAAPARAAAVLAVVVALVGAVLGPTGGLDPLFGARGATVVAGTVERQVGPADWVAAPPGTAVPDGTRLRAPSGVASLALPDGGVDLAEGTTVEVGPALAVRAGSVVVDGAVDLRTAGIEATGDGVWRWDATGRVGAYDGSVVVTDATGRERLVRRFQQTRVRDAVVIDAPRPYVYTSDDAFDRQHLADAMAVDDYVAALRGGLTAQYGTAPQPPAFYVDFDGLDGQLVAALGDVGFDREGDRVGPPADVLVAAVVTSAIVSDAGLAPVVAADEVRALRLDGATWGLVAQGRDLDAGNVRAAADRALARRAAAEQQGVAVPAVPASAPADVGTTPAPTPTTPPSSGAPDTDGGSTDDGGATPPPDGSDTEDEPGPLGSIVDETGATDLLGDDLGGLVDDVVDAGDDLLGGPDPGTSGAADPGDADGLLDATEDVVGGTVDTLEGAVGTVLGR